LGYERVDKQGAQNATRAGAQVGWVEVDKWPEAFYAAGMDNQNQSVGIRAIDGGRATLEQEILEKILLRTSCPADLDRLLPRGRLSLVENGKARSETVPPRLTGAD